MSTIDKAVLTLGTVALAFVGTAEASGPRQGTRPFAEKTCTATVFRTEQGSMGYTFTVPQSRTSREDLYGEAPSQGHKITREAGAANAQALKAKGNSGSEIVSTTGFQCATRPISIETVCSQSGWYVQLDSTGRRQFSIQYPIETTGIRLPVYRDGIDITPRLANSQSRSNLAFVGDALKLTSDRYIFEILGASAKSDFTRSNLALLGAPGYDFKATLVRGNIASQHPYCTQKK